MGRKHTGRGGRDADRARLATEARAELVERLKACRWSHVITLTAPGETNPAAAVLRGRFETAMRTLGGRYGSPID
jgi:hypothetical protein